MGPAGLPHYRVFDPLATAKAKAFIGLIELFLRLYYSDRSFYPHYFL